ncbi:hypothetical protein [Fibrobacter sp.]|uniref:hypothetical protein n=1 Tax=Fibrobacter sp. TaxID=35828 RepID=UPI0025B919CE|nr:hypothetical protein [Fibrobacter sp.]MBR3073597.1 hypothetical protein [Fibrobacter sp.]
MLKKLMAIPGVMAVASFANTPTPPGWWPASDPSFDGVLSKAAPVALAVVVGVAGVRVVIKLINRGAGK